MSEKRYNPSKIKYIQQYQKKNMVSFCLRFNKTTEADLLAYLQSQENKQGFIKELIKADMDHRA